MTPLAGKPALPVNHRQRYRETPDVAAAVERLILTVGRRLAWEDPEGLTLLRRLAEAVGEAWRIAIAGQRCTFSDRQIADALGVTRPAVTQRWPRDAEGPEE